MTRLFSFCLLILLVSMTSCRKSVKEQINQYLENNNLEAESTGDGLYYIIDNPGSEDMPDINSKVTVHYEGTLTDGTKFDSSYDREVPATFELRSVIKGWQLGIPLFGKGGSGKLIIPPSLGYGSSGSGTIPGDAVLVFDIELIDFE